MKTKSYTVYALADPNTKQIMYVGATRLEVDYRLYNHIEEAFMFHREKTWSFSRKHLWLLSLYSKDQLPIVLILVSGISYKKEAYEIERNLISVIKNKPGNTLVNGRKTGKAERPKVKNKGINRVFKKNGIKINFF